MPSRANFLTSVAFSKRVWDQSEQRAKERSVFANRISWRKITITSLTEVTAVSRTNILQERKNRCFEWYKKLVYAGPKSARNILTNLSPNPARLEKPGPTYNSAPTGNQPKNQVAWLHLRPCFVPSCCGASRTIWYCWKLWGISNPPRATAAPRPSRKEKRYDIDWNQWKYNWVRGNSARWLICYR